MKNLFRIILIYTSLTFNFADTCKAQGNIADTIKVADTTTIVEAIKDTIVEQIKAPAPVKPLSWRAVIVPTSMVALGSLAFTSDWLKEVNLFGRKQISGTDSSNRRTKVDNYTMYVPGLAILGLNLAGVRGKNNLLDATILYAMSSGIGNALVFPVKNFTKSVRPDSSEFNSFPSGHTSQAFVSAECLRQEYKDVNPWIGRAGYGVAVLTGFLRMYNNRHWFSDVVAGAGIGILSTRVSYFLYPKIKNLIIRKTGGGNDKKIGYHGRTTQTILTPTYQSGYIGFSFVHQF